MTLKESRSYHEQILLVMGFLGSVEFAGLVFVLQAKSTFDVSVDLFGWILMSPAYFELLVYLLALASFMSIVGSVASARVVALADDRKLLRYFAEACMEGGLFCFTFVLPLLVLPDIPYPQNGIVAPLFFLEGILLVLLGRVTPSNKRPKNVRIP